MEKSYNSCGNNATTSSNSNGNNSRIINELNNNGGDKSTKPILNSSVNKIIDLDKIELLPIAANAAAAVPPTTLALFKTVSLSPQQQQQQPPTTLMRAYAKNKKNVFYTFNADDINNGLTELSISSIPYK